MVPIACMCDFLQLQSRMLYECHNAIHQAIKKMYIDSSETRAAEMRFAGALELSWNVLLPLHDAIEEYASLDAMEAWFQHAGIDEQLGEMWKLLEATFIALRDEVQEAHVEPFVALGDTLARVLVVPGQADVAWRQVHRADELEQPKLFEDLVKDLGSTTSLLFMKPTFIEEFMEAIQKVCFLYRRYTLILEAALAPYRSYCAKIVSLSHTGDESESLEIPDIQTIR